MSERAALWLRVSTGDQTTDNQHTALEAFAGRLGLEVVTTFDVEASAYNGNHRPALKAAQAAAQAGEFDVLVVWALDRLNRQGIRSTLNIIEAFKSRGARVVSLQEPWLNGPPEFTDLLTAVLAWAAQFESSRKSERVKAGMARAAAQGKQIGRPKGSRDKTKRRRAGYFAREESKR